MLKGIPLVIAVGLGVLGRSQTSLNAPVTTTNKVVEDRYSIRMLPGFSAKSTAIGTFRAWINPSSQPASTGYTPAAVDYNSTPPAGENYVYSREYLVPVTATSGGAQQIQGVQFFDGLGRAKQNVAIKSTKSGQDLVTNIPYDGFGRQVDSWLPAPLATKNGDIHTESSVTAGAGTAYGDSFAYAHKVLEDSPLDKVLQQVQPGADWQGKPITFGYDANTDGEVKKYAAPTTWSADGTTSSTLSQGTAYGKDQLYKNTVADEDGNVSHEFKNGRGQTILVRKVLSATESADTYYVYNEYDQLSFVVPPLAAKISALSATDTDLLLYQYRYDAQNRLVEKKLPGRGWEYMVYDRQDRLVATQDANLRYGAGSPEAPGNRWLFTKYDQYGRAAYTGIALGSSRVAEQGNANGASANNVERKSSVAFTQNGMGVYYGNPPSETTYPANIATLLSVNYYDTYPPGTPEVASSFPDQDLLTGVYTMVSKNGLRSERGTKGLPVASFLKNVEDDGWTKNYTFYDIKARPVITYSQNHLGGYTKIESKLTFSGKPEYTITSHKRSSSPTDAAVSLRDTFVYDHQERLAQHKHQVDTGQEVMLAENIYDELGRLQRKNVGRTTEPLQSISYRYNIRGWLTQVNDPSNLDRSAFGYKINYQNPEANTAGSAKYNGNISQILWSTSNDGMVRKYGYEYDKLNRLLSGGYEVLNATPSTSEKDYYNESITYDINGNIKGLKRYGRPPAAGSAQLLDELAYTYGNAGNSNSLATVRDASGNSSGYPSLATPSTILYDANGNMYEHRDKNITGIAYNFLNLPYQVVQGGASSSYVYRADGVKLRKTCNGRQVDYVDGFQYENGALQFVPTAEGYFDFTKNLYIYNYVDHLGNVRVSYYRDPGTGALKVLEENNYYPFGLKHEGYNGLPGNPSYRYKYQGQELQETGFYSFKWRNYMPDVGRFFNIDPLSEKYAYQSHYNFSENKVVAHRELEGLEAVDFKKADNYKNLVIVNLGWSGNPENGKTQYTGTSTEGLRSLRSLENSNTKVVIFRSSLTSNTKDDIDKTISNFSKAHPDGIVAGAGHSLGGENFVEAVNENKNLKVDMLFTVDIAGPWPDDNIPSNVSKAVNYYQRESLPMGTDIEPVEGNKTSKIVNIPVENTTHTKIDDDTAERIKKNIQRELTPVTTN